MECVSGFVNAAVHRGGALGLCRRHGQCGLALWLGPPDFGGNFPDGAGRVWKREHRVPPRPWVCRPGWWGPRSKPTPPL